MNKNLSERYYKCFFTGHRVLGSEEKVKKIAVCLKDEIERLINEHGVETFICGGAIGFDTLAARVVLKLKEKYNWIRLEIYIPCHDHYAKWKANEKEMWRVIAAAADNLKYITNGPYDSGCMHRRNRAMADDAHYCIAYGLMASSGTGVTLKMAAQNNCDIRNIAEYI